MEKVPKDSQGMPPDTSGDVDDVKLGGASVDTALGQMLEVESSPQLERKVLWKIDLM
jgi:hypothetical protein